MSEEVGAAPFAWKVNVLNISGKVIACFVLSVLCSCSNAGLTSVDKPQTSSSVNSMTSYWDLVDPVWDSISIYGSPDTFVSQYSAAPETSRLLFAAHWCQSEVRNGGLHQFFSNSTGVLAPEAIAAYEAIGMPKLSAVVEKAMQWFGPEYPRERQVRNDKLDQFELAHPDDWNPFQEMDDEFYELIDSENGGFQAAADEFATKNGG